jgi:hypothetical protein
MTFSQLVNIIVRNRKFVSQSGMNQESSSSQSFPGVSPRSENKQLPQNQGSESIPSEEAEPEAALIPVPESPRVSRQSASAFIKDITGSLNLRQVYRCFMRRERRGPWQSSVVQLYGADPDPMLVARNRSTPLSTKYQIIEPVSGEQIGTIGSDWRSLRFSISGAEQCKVVYEENFLGRNGTRMFNVILADSRKFVVKTPIPIRGEYFQDFHEVNVIPSIKNFILVDEGDFSHEVLLFGRVSEMVYELRIRSPLSIFTAFAVGLTTLHTGLFHR